MSPSFVFAAIYRKSKINVFVRSKEVKRYLPPCQVLCIVFSVFLYIMQLLIARNSSGDERANVNLVRHSRMHFLLSHMAFHHRHHLHYHRLHLLSLAQCFILNSRPGSSANPFPHRPFRLLPDWLHGLSDHPTFLLCSTAVLVSVLD